MKIQSFKCPRCGSESKVCLLGLVLPMDLEDCCESNELVGENMKIETKNIKTPIVKTSEATMTDYEREVEKMKKWILGLKPNTVKAGRKAAQISIDDFKKKLYNAVPEDERYSPIDEIGDAEWGTTISSLIYSNSILQKDLAKVQFDLENNDANLEIHNGVAFASCRAGGDWEMPLSFFVYFDGKDFRGYVPDEGNFFNKLTKMAFGSDSGDDNLPIFKKIEEMENNCKDGSFPSERNILLLAGIYHLTKNDDIDWNSEPDGLADEHFFEPGGKEEFFARLGI